MTDTLPEAEPTAAHPKRPLFAHALRILALPIILFWVLFAVLVNVIAPQLEVVGELHSAPMAPEDAPSMQAMKLMGANFKEFDSNSTIMVVIEGQQPLGPEAHEYYDEIIRKLRQEPEHIQHIQDFWGDTLTAAGAERRRQGLLRDAEPCGRTRPDVGQRRRSGRSEGHRGHQASARSAGVRCRPGRANE